MCSSDLIEEKNIENFLLLPIKERFLLSTDLASFFFFFNAVKIITMEWKNLNFITFFFFLDSTKTNPYKDINLGLITGSKENCTWWPKVRSWKIRKYTSYMRQWICFGRSGLRIRNPILSPKDAPFTKTSSRIIPISLVNRRFYAMQICIVSGRR